MIGRQSDAKRTLASHLRGHESRLPTPMRLPFVRPSSAFRRPGPAKHLIACDRNSGHSAKGSPFLKALRFSQDLLWDYSASEDISSSSMFSAKSFASAMVASRGLGGLDEIMAAPILVVFFELRGYAGRLRSCDIPSKVARKLV
jgi:hypothetical protein